MENLPLQFADPSIYYELPAWVAVYLSTDVRPSTAIEDMKIWCLAELGYCPQQIGHGMFGVVLFCFEDESDAEGFLAHSENVGELLM